jgi:hypothetical protein
MDEKQVGRWPDDGDFEARAREVLAERDSRVTVGELADAVAEPAADRTRADAHETLYRRSLPSLDEQGVVDFDPDRGVVTPRVSGARSTGQGRSAGRFAGAATVGALLAAAAASPLAESGLVAGSVLGLTGCAVALLFTGQLG